MLCSRRPSIIACPESCGGNTTETTPTLVLRLVCFLSGMVLIAQKSSVAGALEDTLYACHELRSELVLRNSLKFFSCLLCTTIWFRAIRSQVSTTLGIFHRSFAR